MKSLIKLIGYVGNYRLKIFFATVFAILNLFFDLLPEVLLGFAVDTIVNKNNSFLASVGFVNPKYQLILIAIAAISIYFFESLFEYLSEIRWRSLAQIIQHKLRVDVYTHVQSLDLSYFEEQSTGKILSILVDDINWLEIFFNQGIEKIIQLIFGTLLISLVFFYVSPLLALLSFFPIPLILYISFYFKGRLNKLYSTVREKAGDLSAFLSNNLTGIETIKSYTTEKFEALMLEKKSSEYLMANVPAIKITSLFVPVMRMAIMMGQIITIILGGFFALKGTIAVGAYSTLIFLIQRLLWPFKDLSTVADQYERAMASSNRVLKLLEAPIEIKSGDKKINIATIKGHIVFDHVSFKYKNNVTILDDLSFEILPGQTVGFVGPTGSGKSTIIKLLLRFYDPTRGNILLDNINLKDFELTALRKIFGLVSQDVFLINGTIKENLLYGSFEIPYDQIINAAKVSQAYDFIMSLPHQMETTVGERGKKLSGGQRQRISIARSIVKDPRIFIFDEATSSVDNETERAIQESLNQISKDHTTIIIAHRLSTVRHADKIFVLEKGTITEVGTHDELVLKDGLYASLWDLQTGGIKTNLD